MTAKSAEIGRRAERVMPGGDTRTGAYHEPCPLTIVRGEGPFIGDELTTEICERFAAALRKIATIDSNAMS
jgi:hypothetical protein